MYQEKYVLCKRTRQQGKSWRTFTNGEGEDKEMETKSNVFSQLVGSLITAARKIVDETWAFRDFEALIAYFKEVVAVEGKVSPRDFSGATVRLVNNMFFKVGDQDHLMVRNLIMARPELLYYAELAQYLKATQDEEVAGMYVKNFFALQPDFDTELGYDSEIGFTCGKALATIEVMAPDQKVEFAKTALGMFPGLPASSQGQTGLRSILESIVQRAEREKQTIVRVDKVNTNGNGRATSNNGVQARDRRRNVPNVPEGKFAPRPAAASEATADDIREWRKATQQPIPSDVMAAKLAGALGGETKKASATSGKKKAKEAKQPIVLDLSSQVPATTATNGHAAAMLPVTEAPIAQAAQVH